MLGQTMGGKLMSKPESALRVLHLSCYEGLEKVFLSSIPLSAPL